jgi:hypothetical protein
MRKTRNTIDPVKADLLWSAACTAYRLNNGYLKVADMVGDQVIRPKNADLVRACLTTPALITDVDRAQGNACRSYMASSVTMQALKGELQEWHKITAQVCGQDEIKSNYDLAVIASMPQSYFKQLNKESVDARLRRCDETHVGKCGDKVELLVEIVKANYSKNYNTWYVSGITEDNHAVFFGYREQLVLGLVLNIRGTVKRLVDRATQLNRVKVIGETK